MSQLQMRDMYDAIIREDRLWVERMKAIPGPPTDRQLLELDLAWAEALRPLCLRKRWWSPWRLAMWLGLTVALGLVKDWIKT